MPFVFEDDPGNAAGKGPQEGGRNESKASENKLAGRPLINALTSVVTEEKKKAKKQNKASNSKELEVKDTTGDCATAESWNGRTVLNTFDHTLKIFSNGSWQTVASGW